MRRYNISQMRDVGIAIHCQSAGWARTIEARRVKSENRDVDDVAFAGNDDPLVFNRVADLAHHDEPEFTAFRMKMAAICRIERRKTFFVTVNDVCHGSIVVDKSTAPISRVLGQLV